MRARLLLAVGVIALLALVLADVVVYGQLRSNLYSQVDNSLQVAHPAIESTAESAASYPATQASSDAASRKDYPVSEAPSATTTTVPGRATAPSSGSESAGFCSVARQSAPGMFVEVLNAGDRVVTGSDGRETCAAFEPGSHTYSPVIPAHLTGFRVTPQSHNEPVLYFTTASTVDAGPHFRVRAEKLADGDILVLATPITEVTTALTHTFVVEVLVTLAALIAAILLGFWLVRVGLRPLRDIERTAEVIAGGDLVQRVPNPNPRTEVGHLATSFNVMVDRIEDLVTNLRASENRLLRFVGDASHELRTPIAAVSAYAQLFERGDRVTPEDLGRIMTGIRRESSRMARLVEDLLVLAKLDEQRPLQHVPVEVVGLVGESVESATLIGPAWPVRVVATEPVEVVGDHSALRQVVDNLLANVRAHTPEGTETTVSIARRDDRCVIEVADTGPGITEEQATLVFERFFRADPSRSRLSGGAGLGLAIVASIVAQHGGSAEAVARAETGALFRITLPALAPEWDAEEPDLDEPDLDEAEREEPALETVARDEKARAVAEDAAGGAARAEEAAAHGPPTLTA